MPELEPRPAPEPEPESRATVEEQWNTVQEEYFQEEDTLDCRASLAMSDMGYQDELEEQEQEETASTSGAQEESGPAISLDLMMTHITDLQRTPWVRHPGGTTPYPPRGIEAYDDR